MRPIDSSIKMLKIRNDVRYDRIRARVLLSSSSNSLKTLDILDYSEGENDWNTNQDEPLATVALTAHSSTPIIENKKRGRLNTLNELYQCSVGLIHRKYIFEDEDLNGCEISLDLSTGSIVRNVK